MRSTSNLTDIHVTFIIYTYGSEKPVLSLKHESESNFPFGAERKQSEFVLVNLQRWTRRKERSPLFSFSRAKLRNRERELNIIVRDLSPSRGCDKSPCPK